MSSVDRSPLVVANSVDAKVTRLFQFSIKQKIKKTVGTRADYFWTTHDFSQRAANGTLVDMRWSLVAQAIPENGLFLSRMSIFRNRMRRGAEILTCKTNSDLIGLFILTVRHVHVEHLHGCGSRVEDRNYCTKGKLSNILKHVLVSFPNQRLIHSPAESCVEYNGNAVVWRVSGRGEEVGSRNS